MPRRLLGTGPKLEQSPGDRTAGRCVWGGRNEWFKVTGSKWEPVDPYSTGGEGGRCVRTQTARRGGFSAARSAPPASLH